MQQVPSGWKMLEQLGALIDCDYLSYVEFEFETNCRVVPCGPSLDRVPSCDR